MAHNHWNHKLYFSFLYHAAYMSEMVNLWVHREANLNKSPPTESTYSQGRSMDVSNSFGHQFYHPQGHNTERSVIITSPIMTLDSCTLPLWALFCLTPFCPTLQQPDPRDSYSKIHCHLFLSSAELLLREANLSFHQDDCAWFEW